MAKLTVTFKGKLLQTFPLGSEEIGIGSDPSNALRIDSPTVASHHALLQSTPEGYVIRELHPEFPVYVNGRNISEQKLGDGDKIIIGKRSLLFSDEPTDARPPVDDRETPTAPANACTARAPFVEGRFQVMNGKQIGLVIPLRNAVTRIGKETSWMVIVNRRDERYTISAAADDVLVTINGQIVTTAEEPLQDGDVVRINSALLHFFSKEKRPGA